MLKQASACYTHQAWLTIAFVNEYLCVCVCATTDPDSPKPGSSTAGGPRGFDEAVATRAPLPIMPFSVASSQWVTQQACDGHFHVAAL